MNYSHANKDDIHSLLESVAHLLPTQGPIDVFIHHNTLHAFEHLSFEDAVKEAARVYGAEAFLPEQRYLDEFRAGRITERDIDQALRLRPMDGPSLGKVSFHELVKRFLVIAPPVERFQEVKWLLRESDDAVSPQQINADTLIRWLTTHGSCVNRTDALHKLNFEAAESLEAILAAIPRTTEAIQHERTILWAAALLSTAEAWKGQERLAYDPNCVILDEMINPLVIRFCEEYLDLGFSTQLMPDRHEGMLACFLRMVDVAHFGIPRWLEPLRRSVSRYRVSSDDVEKLIIRLLEDLAVSPENRYEYLCREALSLKGWAGYVALTERRPDLLHGQEDEIKPRFREYIAIRLLLRLCAEESRTYHARRAETSANHAELETLDQVYCSAFHILSLFTSLNMGEALLGETSSILPLMRALMSVTDVTRRTLWHLAYENNLYERALNTLSRTSPGEGRPNNPSAQFVFCIDDREESIRRHLEARNAGYQTFGTAGFFGVDANYTMMSGASAPYCPVIIQPKHAIREIPRLGYEEHLLKYRKKQALWFRLSGYVNRGSGSVIHNMVLSMAGCFSLIPMVMGVIAPQTLRFMGSLFGSDPTIPADLHELQVAADTNAHSEQPGYTLEEMATRVASVLRGIGLTKTFAPIVFLVGHGSSSRNNPLRSAYDCGACGGRPGRINARAFCLMANDPKVRTLVRERYGIAIPDSTFFLGAFHNTCSDQMEYFDVVRCPESHKESLRRVQTDLALAARQNAFERCRRFVQAGIANADQAAEEALARSYMLAEARPEYGHATNALCVIGPRSFSQGLFFDRRAFLVSYDSSIDHDSSILLGILRAVVPVCGGINLEYFFSAMDNEVYGAGTKLPHNIVSLVGIMNGTSSDLRTGLPTQMVEIHEPVRLLVVVVASREQLERVIASDAAIHRSFSGGWIQVALRDPNTGEMWRRSTTGEYTRYHASRDDVPTISDYDSWFLGRAGHLPFADIVEG